MNHLLKQWRSGVLVLLLVGPILIYILLGTLWLWQRGWWYLVIGTLSWIITGALFTVLASRWTKDSNAIMPPLDWSAPQTFSPRDREAWQIVEEEAHASEALTMLSLTEADTYVDTGRRLFTRLARHYFPDSTQPLDHVPLIDLLTSLELASEDLAQLSRQVPGSDLITLAHWKRALQFSGYIQKANDWYAYISPILNPISGLTRLGTRELIVKPAWKDMQQNVMRWFFTAYVNRLGVHFIELLSGRLSIGSENYRRLTRRRRSNGLPAAPGEDSLIADIAGAVGSGKSRLLELARQTIEGDPSLLKSRLEARGIDPGLVDMLQKVNWVEIPGYNGAVGNETRRDRSAREKAVKSAVEGDLLILIVDGRKSLQPGDVAFAQAWDRYFIEHPQREAPPTLVALTGVDSPEFGTVWAPPYDWSLGQGQREIAVRKLIDSLRASLPPTFNTFVAVGLPGLNPYGVLEHVIPAIAAQLQRAERSALMRHFQSLTGRSRLGRVASQLGAQGRQAWSQFRSRRKQSSTG